MLKKTIKYTDYNGTERSEDFYFNLSPMEMTRLSVEYPEGYKEHIEKVLDNNDGKELLKMFEYLVSLSYGKKTEDGKHFEKSDSIKDGFLNCPAYDALLMELARDTNAATNFFISLIPTDLANEVKKKMDGNPTVPEEVKNS